ncbi:MAG: TonB-dependent receptor plug domain-containing protein, partial [Saprospiraceae bacterium]|nr:TonB-dependent receptor plug domain-containing protein [Saprospiraceae bacterium]
MKHMLLSLLFIFAVAANGLSQGRTVTGVVLDEDQVPLIGANILLKNSTEGNVGTITDFDGRFSIDVTGQNDTLIFSYTGFIAQEIAVGSRSELQVVLRASSELLEEVIVLGYGVQRKKVATGSISRISSDNIDGVKFQDVQSALEGQVSGLIVNESSGQPGAGKSILIRGISTNGDNSPLFIVDGLQVSSISNISPGDIESIDVLKDAASTAIYGARAANGVVIVTTKKGTEGSGSITYEGYASVDQPWRLPEMLGADDYITLTREKFANGNQLNSLESLGFPNVGEAPTNTDWMDVIFEPAYTQNHRISVVGSNTFLSLEYWDQNGVIGDDKSNYKKYSARLNSSKAI